MSLYSNYHSVCIRVVLVLTMFSACTQTSVTSAVPAADQDPIKFFRHAMDHLRTDNGIPGMSVAVLRNQQVVFAEGFGTVDIENRIPATPDTPYNIASLSKTFAAAILMKLVEEGRLDLDVAMDRNLIVSAESKAAMFSNTISNSGKPLPYGLGWFVQDHAGVKLVWHYGWAPKAYSSLILNVPEKEVTLILFANSEGASANFHLGRGDVLRSPFAVVFLNVFTDMRATQEHF